jgi:malic enzyme
LYFRKSVSAAGLTSWKRIYLISKEGLLERKQKRNPEMRKRERKKKGKKEEKRQEERKRMNPSIQVFFAAGKPI